MKRLTVAAVALVVGMTGTSAFAGDSKIGIVDMQKLMQTSPQTKTIQSKLESEFKSRREQLIAMEDSMKKDMEKFKRDNAVMSASQKQDLQKKIMEAQQKFQTEGQKYQQELSAAHNKAMEELYNKIRTATAKIAEKDKFDLILLKDAAPYSQSAMDVTDKVLNEVH